MKTDTDTSLVSRRMTLHDEGYIMPQVDGSCVIEIRHLCKTYGNGPSRVEALRDINIGIRKGEVFGFIGQSGAGKSSLVRCLAALETATSGQILVDGVELSTLRGRRLQEYRRKLGLVFQHFNLLMNSTVFENVAFPLRVARKPKAYINQRVTELLEMVGLPDKRDAYPAQLSGGQKQRVGIARALAAEPDIVMCDEATSALDPATTESIMELIRDINKKMGITFIIITHEMEVIKHVCDRVAILEDGRVIEEGSVVDVCAYPKTETAKRFFRLVDTALTNKAYQQALRVPGVLAKLSFVGDSTPEPFVSECVNKFGVVVSILSGNIAEVGDTLVGNLVVKIRGTDEAIANALEYMQEHGVRADILQAKGILESKVPSATESSTTESKIGSYGGKV